MGQVGWSSFKSVQGKVSSRMAMIAASAAVIGSGMVGCGNPLAMSGSGSSASPAAGIIGGQDATGSEDFSQSVVSLYNATEGALCTASILSDSIIVTAAHCVDGASPSDLRLIYGTDIRDQAHRVIEAVTAFTENPLYATNSNNDVNTGDIALVKFAGGLPPGYKAAAVLQNVSALSNGATVLLAGYGINDGVASTGAGTLRYVQTTIMNAAFSQTEVLIDQTQGKGACHGDSGGPAFVQVNGKWMLWGVTNRGVNDPQNHCGVSSAYTDILTYASWINETATALMNQQPQQERNLASAQAN